MCGIVGYVGRQDGVPILMEGLQRLEYRGYDSAGIAALRNGTLRVERTAGRVRDLAAKLPKRFTGTTGIAHTRWATHGEPSDRNAHPHVDAAGRFAVVHNGILENAADLRAGLEARGVELTSETDTEVLAHLLALAPEAALEDRLRGVLSGVVGAYGLAVLDAQQPDRLVVACNGSPVILGLGDKEAFVASDVAALVRHTQRVAFLEDGELATLTATGFTTTTLDARPVVKDITQVDAAAEDFELGGHGTWMEKELLEQPAAIRRALSGRLNRRFATSHLGGLDQLGAREVAAVRQVTLLGCGTALYAGMLGAQVIETLARVPAHAEASSEFRYRRPVIDPSGLYIAVSQSGETSDTIAAVQEVQRKGARVLGVVNVVGSSIARLCDSGVYLHAGPELSVASTKAFTSMVVALGLIGLHIGRVRDLGPADGDRLIAAFDALPDQVQAVLDQADAVEAAVELMAGASSAMFVGRASGYPVALEGAQKLKEISYVHAEAYPAGELKHGPLALISEDLPSVVVAPDDHLLDKNVSSMQQIRARSGPVISVGHRAFEEADVSLVVPQSEPELDAVLLTVPLQLLALRTAERLGRDVDRPRNLAKAVTVE